MPRPNEKTKIVDHYDKISPFYHSLWGEHLHHGYWIRGNESKETAQVQMVEHIASWPTSSVALAFWILVAALVEAACTLQNTMELMRPGSPFLPCKWQWPIRQRQNSESTRNSC